MNNAVRPCQKFVDGHSCLSDVACSAARDNVRQCVTDAVIETIKSVVNKITAFRGMPFTDIRSLSSAITAWLLRQCHKLFKRNREFMVSQLCSLLVATKDAPSGALPKSRTSLFCSDAFGNFNPPTAALSYVAPSNIFAARDFGFSAITNVFPKRATIAKILSFRSSKDRYPSEPLPRHLNGIATWNSVSFVGSHAVHSFVVNELVRLVRVFPHSFEPLVFYHEEG